MLSATLAAPSRTFRGPGGIVCACLRITERQLLDTLASTPACSLRDLRRTIGAGDGCTACHDLLRQYLEADAQPSCPPICSDR
jgi:bacterioferritin-associated ferredoxin